MVRDRHGMGWLGWIVTLLVVTGVFWGAYFAWLAPKLPAPYTPPVAESGDYVEVDYRGWFPDTGRTFDTSIQSVAKDNASFQKAASFTYRTGASAYTPLGFVVDCEGTAGCPIEGFQSAVMGLRVGETTTVFLPPNQAYGPADPTKIRVRPLMEGIVATETLNTTEFQERYTLTPEDGTIVFDAVWGWNVTVRVSGDLVTVRHSPIFGQTYTIARKWQAQVVGFDDAANEGRGQIMLRHLLTPADVKDWVATDREGNFIVVALDPGAGTFTVDYNNEVVGQTLAFQITVTTLRKPSP